MFKGPQGLSLAGAVDVSVRSMFQHRWCFFCFFGKKMFCVKKKFGEKNFFWSKTFFGGFLVKKNFWSKKIFLVKIFIGCAHTRARAHARVRTYVYARKLHFKMSSKYKNLNSIINKIFKKVLLWSPSFNWNGYRTRRKF